METVILLSHSEVHVPLHTVLLPLPEPLHLGSGPYEELHLHLLELPHTEDELTCNHLVAEGLSYLGYTERNLHSAGLLDIDIVHEYTLGSLRTQIYGAGVVSGRAELGGEHKVELPYIGPVFGSAQRADDAAVQDNLLVLGEVVCLLRSDVAVVHLLVMGLLAEDIRVGLAELSLIEGLAELAASLLNLLVDFLLNLAQIILDEDIGTISLLGVFVIDERVVESGYVA